MPSSDSVIVLDVGHGNCAVVKSGDAVAIVDAPSGAIVLDVLRDLAVDRIEAVFISHADKDHIYGILSLLTSRDISVTTVYVNPDANRRSGVWRDFLAAVSAAQKSGTCVIRTSLTSTEPGIVRVGNVQINVVAPSAALALTGVGGQTVAAKAVTANSMSAVLRVETEAANGLLLTGDLDDVGLDDAVSHGANLNARVLVFPHHGGLPGTGSPGLFVSKLLQNVSPETVIFSNGRQRHDNPRPQIVASCVSHGCSIACTQLSKRCYSDEAPLDSSHLEGTRGDGGGAPASCAGSMSIRFEDGARRSVASHAAHQTFIDKYVPAPMCRRPI
jgi:beta-lactamase superfamily II metal-dependent hydrolase